MRAALHAFPWKPMAWILGLSAAAALATCAPVHRASSPEQALVEVLRLEGMNIDDTDLSLVDKPSAFRPTRAVARASRPGEPTDIFLVRAQVAPSGCVVGTPSIFNLTDTPMADEGAPSVSGTKVAFVVREGGAGIGIRSLDIAGQPPLEGQWSTLERLQHSLTNLQQTGQTEGVAEAFWSVDPPADTSLVFNDTGHIEARVADETLKLPIVGGLPDQDSDLIVYRPSVVSRPGNLVTWSVDRVRAFPWFGDDRMQLIKAVAFDVMDRFRRTQTDVMGDDTAEDIAQDLGDIGTRHPPTTYRDPDTGWPPPPIEPFLSNAIAGEGQWIPLEDDPFIQTNRGAPPAFVTTFVRTDRERSYTRIYVTAWDPRQIELHMMAGSVEPKGASGVAGPGLIPRTPQRMKRLVAGLNGGFQALHGEFGMMADGVVYLPPKPYAATVTEMSDGSTGFGSWPEDPTVPAEVLSYRQNLTVLVLDGVINPYKRGWWGGTPPEWEDRVHSTRTGMCMTKEGFIAYFYGNEIDMKPLAQAMVQARCTFGMHLDMNPGHTGLEFYKVAPAGELPDLGRPLDKKWEAQGPVPRMDGWEFRARRMVRFMGLMNFPRYIQREGRDFFYLTLRPVLPGDDVKPVVEPGEADEGKWRTQGLPQHGFPYAVATTYVRPDASRAETQLFLLKIDPKTVAARLPSQSAAADAPATVVTLSNADVQPKQPTLWLQGHRMLISDASPGDGASAIVSGLREAGTDAVVAAVGVQDDDGMLVYAEVQGERQGEADGALLASALEKLGCSTTLLLTRPLLPTFGEEALPRDAKGNAFGRQLILGRQQAPGARRVFESTPVVDAKVWYPLQAKRIRYFKKNKP